MEHYRPITLANFKFKIITKNLADRLTPIMPSWVSINQHSFIQGRNIKDYICLVSEVVNMLDMNHHFGKLAMKMDTSKAFDTLSWKFLLSVLKKFYFFRNILPLDKSHFVLYCSFCCFLWFF